MCFPQSSQNQQLGADVGKEQMFVFGKNCYHSGSKQVGGSDNRGTNPILLPVPTTKPILYIRAPSSLLLHAYSLAFAMHHGCFHPISCRVSQFSTSLNFGGVSLCCYSPWRKVQSLLPSLPPAAVSLLVNVRNHSSCTAVSAARLS